MGFRYRKSINLGGGFKINLSKSGIGYSWGTKGYRVTKTARGTTRTTLSVPGTGLSYVKENGKKNRSNNSRANSNNQQFTPSQKNPYAQQTPDPFAERSIKSAAISNFKETEEGTISAAIERTMRMNTLGIIMLFGILLIGIHPALLVIPIFGILFIVAAHTLGRVKLEYSFDPEKQDEHLRRIDAWQLLVEGNREWQILTEKYNNNRRVNAGAGRLLKRIVCKIEKGAPYYIKTNVETIQIVLHNRERLIILPDKVFFVRKNKVGLIDYSDFKITTSSTRFVETEAVPKDAKVVDYTWQYVNNNGTPDRRFKNNRRLPICLYGQVFLRSDSGLNVELQISNEQNTRDFAELIV